jgi:hypothetical protein
MTTKLIRYYRRGWRIGWIIARGHKWVTVRTIKPNGVRGKYKILRSNEAAEVQELPTQAV